MSAPSVAAAAVRVADVVRGGVVESVHHGHLVATGPDGEILLSAGDPDGQFFARSSLKPLQVVAMLRAGLQLDGPLLALACASHNGEPHHVEGARSILGAAGLDESALQNTPDYPLDDAAALAWRSAGSPKEPVAQNCSGKHAAMLATCVAAGWDTATYRDPQHALQRGRPRGGGGAHRAASRSTSPSTGAGRRCSRPPSRGWPGPSAPSRRRRPARATTSPPGSVAP